MADFVVSGVEKFFGSSKVLKGINLSIPKGEFFSLLGPSGCGKTTLLRIIAGFEHPSAGWVEFEGQKLTDLPPHKRPINTVFQNYALFPHMSVFDNIAFGLKLRKVPKPEIVTRVQEILELVNLPGYGVRSIPSLSGGEKQRVALARALVNRPQILLLDEPLGALDLQLRRKVQFEIKEIHRKIGTTFIYVTHDQEEALAMSDRIAVMQEGNIEQVGTPQEIYDRPNSKFVAHFIGSSNLFDAIIKLRGEGSLMAEVEVNGLGSLQAAVRNGALPGEAVSLLIRPEKIEIVHDSSRAQGWNAVVTEKLYLGPLIQYKLKLQNEKSLVAVQHVTSNRTLIQPGNKVRVRWANDDMVVLEK